MPQLPSDPITKVAAVAAHSGAVTLSASAFLVSGAMLILALVALNALQVTRARGLVRAGAIITAIATIWPIGGRAAFNLVMVAISGADHSSAAATAKAIDTSGAFDLLLVSLLAFVAGPVVLTIGLWRARIAPVWPAVLWLAGIVVVNAAEGSSRLVATTGMALVTAALAWLGAAAANPAAADTRAGAPVLGTLS
jgi:hypothetical protein